MLKKEEINQDLVNLVIILQEKKFSPVRIKQCIMKETGWGKTKAGEVYKAAIRGKLTKMVEIKNEPAQPPKILLIDIETAPSLGYVWGKWEQNVIEFKEDWYMLSFAFKWLGDKKVQARILPDYPFYKKNPYNDKYLIEELWRLFDEADIIIAHHGDGFDVKKSNARFITHNLTPPSPYKTIDTLKIARRYFKFDSNKLDDLAQYLKIGRKAAHEGKNTWLGCMTGDMKSWGIMKKYNAHDVTLLEEVYLRLRGWASTHPNLDNFTKNGNCPNCQSPQLQRRGWNVAKTGKRSRLHCQKCGAWSSGSQLIKT